MTEQELPAVFQQFKQLTVLVVGDVMLDSYIWGTVDRVSPEAPVPVVQVKKRDFRMGGAANVALNVQALGAKPIICSLIGDDDAGKKFLSTLDAQGMSRDGIIVTPSRPTTVKTRVIASHQHVVRVDDESDAPANAAEQQQMLERIEKLLPQCQVVIFEDYDKGVLNLAVIEKIVEWAGKRNIPTVVDPKKRNFMAYRNVTLFKPNVKELREGLKIDLDGKDTEQVSRAVEEIKTRLNAKGVMATLSEHGVYINFGDEKLKLPAHKREIADVSGAGDTVISIAGLCVALNLNPKITASLSNLGGGLVCQHVGVVPINRAELLEEALKAGI